jgi:hypothetical protein
MRQIGNLARAPSSINRGGSASTAALAPACVEAVPEPGANVSPSKPASSRPRRRARAWSDGARGCRPPLRRWPGSSRDSSISFRRPRTQGRQRVEDVGVDGPLELRNRGVDVRPNRGQGGRDDQRRRARPAMTPSMSRRAPIPIRRCCGPLGRVSSRLVGSGTRAIVVSGHADLSWRASCRAGRVRTAKSSASRASAPQFSFSEGLEDDPFAEQRIVSGLGGLGEPGCDHRVCALAREPQDQEAHVIDRENHPVCAEAGASWTVCPRDGRVREELFREAGERLAVVDRSATRRRHRSRSPLARHFAAALLWQPPSFACPTRRGRARSGRARARAR